MTRSAQLFEEARRWIPGGVNSPVRAFAAIGGSPRFIARADGAYLTDVDGNRYIDYVCSWGPMLLGHNRPEIREAVSEAAARGLSYGAATELEVEMARLVCRMVPGLDMVRMVNSGTEAVMSAIRAARGYTRRDKIIKFQGCYHGHSDCLLVKAGSGVMTAGMPGSAGVPAGCTSDTLTAEYNDLAGVEALFKANPDSVACVVVEPVAANMGVVLPSEGFLQGLRQLCDQNGSLLLFDEDHRLPFVAGRGSGIFWRAAGSDDLWKDHRRGNAGGRLRWKTGDYGAGEPLGPGLSCRDPQREPGSHGGGAGPAHFAAGPSPVVRKVT